MSKRLELQNLLVGLIGSRNVYFQPPETLKMNYPAIVFKLDNIDNDHADDSVYRQSFYYRLTVIDKDPESKIMMKVSKLPGIRWVSSYVSNNLYHYVFTLYY